MDSSPTTLRDPGTLFYQKDVVRRSIISAYWAVIILSLPLWWYATSIERLTLPSRRVQQLAQQNLTLPVTVCIEANAPLVNQVQNILTARISQEPNRWKGLAVQLEGRVDCGMSLNSSNFHLSHNNCRSRIRKRNVFSYFKQWTCLYTAQTTVFPTG